MDVKQTLNHLDLQSEIVAFAISAVAILLILYLNHKRLIVCLREWRIRRCLDKIGIEQIRDLVCSDGLEGYYNIDRLALTAEAILVIAYKPHVGNIYCAEHITEWTQVVGQKSFKFHNPLFELENQITALTLAFGSIPLQGYLFFSNSAVFPRGHPESVLQPDNIPLHFQREQSQQVREDVRAAWEQLKWQQANPGSDSEAGVKT
jgi:hypothetical protein